MNVKKMTTEHLHDEIEFCNSIIHFRALSQAEQDFLDACKKELARRWGIKQ